MGIIITIIIGILAGYIAGLIWKGGGFGLIGNLAIGIAGAFIGGFLFRLAQFRGTGLISDIITATVGALLLLWVINKIR